MLHDALCPFDGGVFELVVGDDGVDHAHAFGFVGGVELAEIPDLACFLLADHAGEV